MKVFISMPPLNEFVRGTPQLAQNRQYQVFQSHSTIYPVLLASAATLLNSKGYDVVWDDAITKQEPYQDWIKKIANEMPEVIAIESKTPVIKYHFEIIKDIHKFSPYTKVILMGDHVKEFPQEALAKGADFVLKTGDYDIELLNVLEVLEGKHLTKIESLDELPFVDRELTNWKDYAFNNGNFKYTPGTYIQSARDCWWGKCTFCSWANLYPLCSYRRRSPEDVVDEIEYLVNTFGVREIFDDAGTIPAGPWLTNLCNLLIAKGLNKKVRISCNARFGILKPRHYKLMRKAGFRFLLFGLESGSQDTLDLIDKGIKVKDITQGAKWASEAGLNVHLTCMIGYPWEGKKHAEKTIALAKKIFNRGHADTLQGTFVVPYPNTKLYKECLKNNQLKVSPGDWCKFDMRNQIMKSPLSEEEIKDYVSQLYRLAFSPKFILRQILNIRCWEDVVYIFRGAKSITKKHLKDFR